MRRKIQPGLLFFACPLSAYLLCWFLCSFALAQVPTNTPPVPTNGPAVDIGTPPAAPPASAPLSGFILSLVANHPWLASLIFAMGTFRLALKPTMLAIEWYAKQTPNPDDDVAVLKFEAGPIYKCLSIGLDFLGSIKLPAIVPPKSGGKTVSLVFAVALLMPASGCALFRKDTTTEQKAADVRSLCYAAASIGTSEAVKQNPAWRAQFVAAEGNLDQLVTQKTVTGDLLRNVVAGLPVKELKSDSARIAIEGATTLFDATVGNALNIEAQPYILAAATGIRDGMKAALGL